MNELEEVLDALDERARNDQRLDRYRVRGQGTAALDDVPDGWHVSDAIEHIAASGGWWPGEWHFPVLDETVTLVLTRDDGAAAERSVRWLGIGTSMSG